MRAAILTAFMNLTPIAAVDIFRFLRVPAIVMTIRAAHTCAATTCRRRRVHPARRRGISGAPTRPEA